MNYKNILVSFEDEKHDVEVLKHAVDLAKNTAGNITLLHINSPRAGAPSYARRGIEHKYTQGELREIVEEVSHKIPVDIKLIRSSYTVDTIVNESQNCDLLVLGHRHVNFIEMMLGDSIDEKVINKVDCDCLVIKQAS